MSDDVSTPDEGLMKRWMSEPTLLGDYDDDDDDEWLKRDSKHEDSLSFTDEVVVQPNLHHVTKERVQFRPKRRPPSREFIKSRASMDFDFSVPEKITEEAEDEEGTPEEEGEPEKQPVRAPVPPPKPKDPNAFKLPTFDPSVVLRKTASSEPRKTECTRQDSLATTASETSEDSVDIQEGSPAKQKKRRKIKIKLFGNLRHRRDKEAEKKPPAPEKGDTNRNLRKCASVDSGVRPLGEHHSRSWLHRRVRHKPDERRNLNWLLGIFQRKNSSSSHGDSTPETQPTRNGMNTNSDKLHDIEEDKIKNTVNQENLDESSRNGTARNETVGDDDNNESHESVSDLKKKFEKRKF